MVDKSATLQHMLEVLDYTPADVVAFGDDLPDLGLFQFASARVAMVNAIPELKEQADVVIGDCDDDCIGPLCAAVLPPLTSSIAIPDRPAGVAHRSPNARR